MNSSRLDALVPIRTGLISNKLLVTVSRLLNFGSARPSTGALFWRKFGLGFEVVGLADHQSLERIRVQIFLTDSVFDVGVGLTGLCRFHTRLLIAACLVGKLRHLHLGFLGLFLLLLYRLGLRVLVDVLHLMLVLDVVLLLAIFFAIIFLLLLHCLSLLLHHKNLFDLFLSEVLFDHFLLCGKTILFNVLLTTLNLKFIVILFFYFIDLLMMHLMTMHLLQAFLIHVVVFSIVLFLIIFIWLITDKPSTLGKDFLKLFLWQLELIRVLLILLL